MQPTSLRRGSSTFLILGLLVIVLAGVGLFYLFGKPRGSGQLDIPLNESGPDLAQIEPAPGDWPWWRGPTRDGHSPDKDAPLNWSETSNVVWKQPIPGRGFSSPIVIGNQIVMTSAEEEPARQFVIALDRQTGEKLWDTTAHKDGLMLKHYQNTHASASCAFDGERIFASFVNSDALRLTALDRSGRILWQKEVGPHGGRGSHGGGPSPAICGNYVIMNDDSPAGGFIAAVHRTTGEIAWRKKRSPGQGSYGTPIVAELGGKQLILLSGCSNLTAYDPKSGNEEWVCPGIDNTSANTVTFGGDMAFAGSGHPKKLLIGVRADGAAAWTFDRRSALPYPPSMIWDRGYLYIIGDEGIATCLDAKTGTQRWTNRLDGQIWASPILVGNRIYVPNRKGTTFVFEASPERFNELARNKLEGDFSSTPVAIGGKLYIRSETHLYCIGK